ncbi:hypothetical protein RvY_09150 [Ramazzottius varieornatus]|uniref:Uncharacterized protein n=1 Tax=Ramazzottius varieornatus TaxID=947166 RepID=A0A1D1VCY1_RAMVA|nr:hypothetical protein RvY_09150 [Ramazzottius varieornatus]
MVIFGWLSVKRGAFASLKITYSRRFSDKNTPETRQRANRQELEADLTPAVPLLLINFCFSALRALSFVFLCATIWRAPSIARARTQ